jgi:urease accessory protein
MRSLFTACGPVLLGLAGVALPLAVAAHTGVDGGSHHGFTQGFLHPLTGPDHLLAMLAVGLWSALAARTSRDLWWAPAGFATMLLAGALLGWAGVQTPGVEPMIAASLLVTGLLVATRLQAPGPVAAAAVGLFAVFHGIAHGHELSAAAGAAGAAAALAGMVLATLLLHLAGMTAGWSLRDRGAWLARWAGGAVALFGVALLSRAV